MYNIIIIGAGQLGSRHLQGVLKSTYALNVTVVDPSEESLNTARERAEKISKGNAKTNINYMLTVPEGEFLVAIISTNANVRTAATENIVNKAKVKYIIFEKILFQKISDYSKIKMLLEENNINAWVNCPRRIYPVYQKIKENINNKKPIEIIMTGKGWGMACNSIHFIDLFSFITGKTDYKVIDADFNNKFFPSKRNGFFEVEGEITIKTETDVLKLICAQGDSVTSSVIIKNNDNYFDVNETGGVITSNLFDKKNIEPIFQSNLTGSYIEELIENNNSSLTPFSDSMEIHLPFISLIQEHLSKAMNKELQFCPIT